MKNTPFVKNKAFEISFIFVRRVGALSGSNYKNLVYLFYNRGINLQMQSKINNIST